MHIKFSVAELQKNGLTESQIQYKIKAHEEKCRDNRTKGTDSNRFNFLELIEYFDFESVKRSKIQAHREQNGNGTRTLCQYRKEWQWI